MCQACGTTAGTPPICAAVVHSFLQSSESRTPSVPSSLSMPLRRIRSRLGSVRGAIRFFWGGGPTTHDMEPPPPRGCHARMHDCMRTASPRTPSGPPPPARCSPIPPRPLLEGNPSPAPCAAGFPVSNAPCSALRRPHPPPSCYSPPGQRHHVPHWVVPRPVGGAVDG